jgi:hypothetical protein
MLGLVCLTAALYYELAADDLIDEEQLEKDYRNGRWGQPGYQTPYKAQSNTTLAGVTENIVAGRIATTVLVMHSAPVFLWLSRGYAIFGCDQIGPRSSFCLDAFGGNIYKC